jgi:hypothetical protein
MPNNCQKPDNLLRRGGNITNAVNGGFLASAGASLA